MPIESPQYIDGLDPANPDGKDPIAQGDNHIRLIKAMLLSTFPNIEGEVTATHDEINELSGLQRLPDAPAQEGSMLYSSGGKWVETDAIKVADTSVDIGADINVVGDITAKDATFDSLTVNGSPLDTYFTAGEGIDISGATISMSGTYSGTFTAADVVATSDERKKEQITTAPSEVIAAIQGREWVWKESGEKGSGVIAQELEAAGLGHLVHTNDDGFKAVSYNGLFAYVIEELKALRAAYERDCK